MLRTQPIFVLTTQKKTKSSHILIDSDGFAFVNYLIGAFNLGQLGLAKDAIKVHKKHIEKALYVFRSNPRVWNKYRWLAQYHDFFVATWMPDEAKTLGIAKEALKSQPSYLYEYVLPSDFKIPWEVHGEGHP